MGFVQNSLVWMGFADTQGEYHYDEHGDGYDGYEDDDDARPRFVRGENKVTRLPSSIGVAPTSFDKINTERLHSYEDARAVGEAFRKHHPVVLDLSGMDSDSARRVVDFASGLAFALRGKFEKIHPDVFLLTPQFVQIAPAHTEKDDEVSSSHIPGGATAIAPRMEERSEKWS